jgi:hypothetical protein
MLSLILIADATALFHPEQVETRRVRQRNETTPNPPPVFELIFAFLNNG